LYFFAIFDIWLRSHSHQENFSAVSNWLRLALDFFSFFMIVPPIIGERETSGQQTALKRAIEFDCPSPRKELLDMVYTRTAPG
jgi:hypothetical protein